MAQNEESSHQTDSDPLDKLAQSFIERHRRGEPLDIAEYAEQYPELADQIRELFPTLLDMEQLGARLQDVDSVAPVHGVSKSPKEVGGYAIIREVGRGGMGVVYEAEDQSLGRHVALKVLPFHRLLDERRLERFRREARAAAALEHPAIVPVYGIGEDRGVHYYAMQFIRGQSLDQVLREIRQLRRNGDAIGSLPQPDDSSDQSVIGLL